MKHAKQTNEFLTNKMEEIKEMLSSVDLDDEDLNDVDYNDVLKEISGLDLNELNNQMSTYSQKLELHYKKNDDEVKTPTYNYGGDSGFDLYSTEEITIPGFGRALIPTGLSFDIPDGYEIQVRSKSGLAINQGLMVLNSPGTVDNSYTGEVKAIIFNTNKDAFTIMKGMKVAQAVLCPVVNGKWVNLISKDTLTDKDRADKGFGSTGLK